MISRHRDDRNENTMRTNDKINFSSINSGLIIILLLILLILTVDRTSKNNNSSTYYSNDSKTKINLMELLYNMFTRGSVLWSDGISSNNKGSKPNLLGRTLQINANETVSRESLYRRSNDFGELRTDVGKQHEKYRELGLRSYRQAKINKNNVYNLI
eukprot:UN31876